MFFRNKRTIAEILTSLVVVLVVVIATCLNWQRQENDFSRFENNDKFCDSKSHCCFFAINYALYNLKIAF